MSDAVPAIPWRVAIVQRTLPHYRLGTFSAVLNACKEGSALIHGKVHSRHQPKQNAYLGPVTFPRIALDCWSMPVRIGEQVLFPVFTPGLLQALRKIEPDVILTEGESNLLNNFMVLRYARSRNVPYIWWGLGAIPGGRPSGLRRIFGGILKRAVAGAAGVACYSSAARAFYIGQGARAETCKVVPNALDDASVAAGIERFGAEAAARRTSYGVAPDDLVVLTVGSLEKPKRIELALEAMDRLRNSRRRIHYWIVGDGPERSNIEAKMASLKLENIRLWGSRYDDVSLFFLMADLFLLPGLGGLAINQAMMHGLPVICGAADGTEADLLDGGNAGILLDETNPDTIANAITTLSNVDLQTMGAVASKRIESGVTLKHQLFAMSELIAAVMASRG